MLVHTQYSSKIVMVGSVKIPYQTKSEYEQLKAKAKELGLTFSKVVKKKKPKKILNGPVTIIKLGEK